MSQPYPAVKVSPGQSPVLCFCTLRIHVQNTDFKTLQGLKISNNKFYYGKKVFYPIPGLLVLSISTSFEKLTKWYHSLPNSCSKYVDTLFPQWLSCMLAKGQFMSVVLILVIT